MSVAPVPEESVVWEALRRVADPEVGENVVDLGLVYRVECTPGRVHVDMTMTSPACPMAESIAQDAEGAIRRAFEVAPEVSIAIVYDPPWTPERMSEQVRGRFGW